MTIRPATSTCLLAVLAVQAAWADQTPSFQFGDPLHAATGPQPWALAAADLNGDHMIDLAVANREPASLWIYLNNGRAGFAEPTVITGFESVLLSDVTAEDMNGDGHTDLVLTFRGNVVQQIDSGVAILLNDGNGALTNLGLHASCVASVDGSAADFNSDGIPDVSTTGDLCQRASVLLGTGGGSLGLHAEYGAGYTCRGNAVADLDGDDRLDIAFANSVDSLTLLLGNGDGTFSYSMNNVQQVGNLPQAVYAADLDQNGQADLFTANRYSNNLTVLFNEGNLSFTRMDYPAGNEPLAAAVADLDRDGALDLAVGNGADGSVSVMRSNGLRAFAAPQTIMLQGEIGDVIAADLNGDGAPDLAAVSETAGVLTVLINETPQSIPGDVDQNGAVDVADLLALLAAWGPCAPGDPCAADVDHDGTVAIGDLLTLLSNWS